jgi:phosphonate transport system permease protein
MRSDYMEEQQIKPIKGPSREERKPPLVPPIVATILSLIIPGLGQMLARYIRRGILLLAGLGTLVGLFIWRVNVATTIGIQVSGFFNKTMRALRLNPLLIVVAIAIIGFYLWIAYDAYRVSSRVGAQPVGVFVILLIALFLLGWQIGEINLYELFTQAGDALPALSSVLWPWERAVNYPEEILVGTATIMSPCEETPNVQKVPEGDIAYLLTEPTCGDVAESPEQPGTTFVVHGYNFRPGIVVEIWWKDPLGNEFHQRSGGKFVTVTPDANGEFEITITMPYRLIPITPGQSHAWLLEGKQLLSVGKAEVSPELFQVIEKMVETIIIGMMATIFGILFAIPVSFLAARNLMSASPVTMGIYYVVRTILNIIRSIEPLIWAIIAVIVVGLGPFAGILALTLHSIAALGKLYSESIESIEPGPIEAVQATGANWLQRVMYAVIPQIVPPFTSFTIYRWDINIRMSTVIGFVGGGGIGFLLAQWIRLLDYRSAGMAVWFIAITVAILDYVSAEIRARII